jgi:hypothetical protein
MANGDVRLPPKKAIFGNTFYRVKDANREGGQEAVKEISRKKPNIKNRVDVEIKESVIAMALDNPALGQMKVSNELLTENIEPLFWTPIHFYGCPNLLVFGDLLVCEEPGLQCWLLDRPYMKRLE